MPLGTAGIWLAALASLQPGRQWLEISFQVPPGPSPSAILETPNGQKVQHPAFRLSDGSWRIRINPIEDGAYRLLWGEQEHRLEKSPSWMPFIRISEQDPRYFEAGDGSACYPLGPNLRRAEHLSRTIPLVSQSGGNYARVLVPDLLGAERLPNGRTIELLEGAVESADFARVRLQVALLSMDSLRAQGESPGWQANPLNRANGGPLGSPKEFWTNSEAEAIVRVALHEVVARFAATPAIFAWELFDRAEFPPSHDAQAIGDWHRKMAAYIREIDPYKHPITSGFSSPLASRELEQMPEFDFATSQVFSTGDIASSVSLMHYRKAGFGKPHMMTSVGGSLNAGWFGKDPKGFQNHDALWASIASGASGGAVPWWWDDANLPPTFYRRFLTAGRFIEGVHWSKEFFRPLKATLAYQGSDAPVFYSDLVMEGGPISMDDTKYNWPRLVRIDPKRVRYGLPVAGILHGRRNRPSKHNPLTLRMDLERPTVLDITVGDVSGQGGARLKVWLDGRQVLDRDFPDPNDAGEPLVISQFRQRLSLPVPAGHRVLKIENVGRDWMHAGYRLRDLFPRKSPPLAVIGSAGEATALVWIKHEHRSWLRMIEQGRPVAEVPPTTLTIAGLRGGKWNAELWDTWRGAIVKQQEVLVDRSGLGEIRLPAISTDIAVKLKRAGRSGTKS